MAETDLMTRAQVAKRIGVGVRTIDSWVISGLLARIKIGRTVRFSPEEVERLSIKEAARSNRAGELARAHYGPGL